MFQPVNHIWLLPALTLLVFGIGAGLVLLSIKAGAVLIILSWLLCIPTVIYVGVKLTKLLLHAPESLPWIRIGAALILGVLVVAEFVWVIYFLKNFKLKLF